MDSENTQGITVQEKYDVSHKKNVKFSANHFKEHEKIGE